jgi:tetratricopeptide (TPR) repeat protein
MLARAESEYRKALKLNPNDPNSYIALADVQYRARKYANAATLYTLRSRSCPAPIPCRSNPMISAQLARCYAQLGRSSDAMQAIDSAERAGGKGLQSPARDRGRTAHPGPSRPGHDPVRAGAGSSDEDRLQVRLALGRLFAEEGKTSDAQQQVALGFAEARVAPPM